MAKEIKSLYFPHDIDASRDQKLQRAMVKHGPLAYAAFFMILEKLANEGGCLYCDYEGISYETHIDVEIIRSVIENFSLFEVEETEKGKIFKSKRLLEWICLLNESKKKRSDAGKKGMQSRWHNNVITNDNGVITNDNKLKENIKVNKNYKEKEIKEKETQVVSEKTTETTERLIKQPKTTENNHKDMDNDIDTGIFFKEKEIKEKESAQQQNEKPVPPYVRRAYNKDVEERYSQMLQSGEKGMTDIAISTQLTLQKLKEFVPIFIAQCRATECSHTSFADYKYHFINFVNKKKTDGTGKTELRSDAERRRGEDYISSNPYDYDPNYVPPTI